MAKKPADPKELLKSLRYVVDNHEWCSHDPLEERCSECHSQKRCEDNGHCEGCGEYLAAVRLVYGLAAGERIVDDWRSISDA